VFESKRGAFLLTVAPLFEIARLVKHDSRMIHPIPSAKSLATHCGRFPCHWSLEQSHMEATLRKAKTLHSQNASNDSHDSLSTSLAIILLHISYIPSIPATYRS
jgi:hypothetical protein